MVNSTAEKAGPRVISAPVIEKRIFVMFQLCKDEAAALRSQIATSNVGRGGRRYAPYVFTEQGVAMLSSVLRSKTAIAANIEIMRAFVERPVGFRVREGDKEAKPDQLCDAVLNT